MNRDEIEAEVSLLLLEMENQPQDNQELQLQVLAKLNEMRAFGMPLPQDLVDLERALQQELARRKR